MVCPDCKGERGRWVRRRVGCGHQHALAQIQTWEPCGGCGGTGIAHCCDGPVGCAADVTNTGETNG